MSFLKRMLHGLILCYTIVFHYEMTHVLVLYTVYPLGAAGPPLWALFPYGEEIHKPVI